MTGFCLSASDAQTVAFSAHFTFAAVSFLFDVVVFFVPNSSVFHAGKIQMQFNKLLLTHTVGYKRLRQIAIPGFLGIHANQGWHYFNPKGGCKAPGAVWLKNNLCTLVL